MRLRIGEFARLTKVSVKMLRHYDRIGLLRPARFDESTGYRYYTATQLPRLNRIVMLRDLGFSLRHFAALVDAASQELLAATEAQLRAVRACGAVAVDALDAVVRATPRTLVATMAAVPPATRSTGWSGTWPASVPASQPRRRR
jgi:DNA-binding transcriptional MerR regulator